MEQKIDVVQKNEEVLLQKQSDERSIELLSVIVQNLVQPFTESQKVTETEITKRHEISTKSDLRVVYAVFLIGVLIIGLAYIALYQGIPTLAEKIVVAVISFLAGLGVGRTTSKSHV